MEKIGAGGLILVAVVMLATGLVLRSDLVDWLMDAVGFVFIAGGLTIGVVGLLKLLMGRRGRRLGPTG